MKGGQDESKEKEDGMTNSGGQRREREHLQIKEGGIKHNQVATMKVRN